MKFLEVENIHTERDSIKSTTETAMQNKTVLTTCDWHNEASLANMKCGPNFINQHSRISRIIKNRGKL